MSRNGYLLIAVFVLLIGAFALWNYLNPRFDWRERYQDDNKDPYNTFVISELLRRSFPNQPFKVMSKRIHQDLNDSTETAANYVFVGQAVYADSADIEKWLHFAEKGNTVFIASDILPEALFHKIYYENCGKGNRSEIYRNTWDSTLREDVYRDSSVFMNFKHAQLHEKQSITYKYAFENKNKVKRWHYFDSIPSTCVEHNLVTLGTFQNKYVNFAKIDYGKGHFYFHNNPIIFTNYFLLDSNHLRYTSKVFGHLTNGAIYWDPISRVPAATGQRMNDNDRMGRNRPFDKDSPLQYILSQPALAWAWYLFISSILLYMFFAAKRVQRLIPVLPQKTNDSLGFIKTVGRVYFLQNDSVKLCAEMLQYFQIFVREKYRISGQLFVKDAPALTTLIAKSGIEATVVRTIAAFERRIENRNIVEHDAVELYRLLKIFYKNCK
ncbi:MAG: hypothetical protein RLZZ628_517 [Bacteroidota bacterium]|jgi:hypothetical protein